MLDVTGVEGAIGGVGGPVPTTTGAFASAVACLLAELRPPAPFGRFEAGMPYEVETIGIVRRLMVWVVRMTRDLCTSVVRVAARVDATELVVAERAAAGSAGGLCSVGIATCGKCASGIVSVGIAAAAAGGGLSAARTAATIALV